MKQIVFFYSLSAFFIAGPSQLAAQPVASCVSERCGAVSFEWPRKIIVVPATIGTETVMAMIDTGSPQTIVSVAYAKRHGYRLDNAEHRATVGGTTEYFSIPPRPIYVAGRLVSTAVNAVDFSNFVKASGSTFDVVIGSDALKNADITIDFDMKRIHFFDEIRKIPSNNQADIHYDLSRQRILTSFKIGQTVFNKIDIDTGLEDGVILSKESSSSIGRDIINKTDIEREGYSGRTFSPVFTLGTVTIGKSLAKNVPSSQEGEDAYLTHTALQGAIGLGLLSRYNVTFNLAHQRLTLLPRAHADPPPLKSSVGVQGTYLSDRIAISHVMANSPAAAAGLREGDQICAVNDSSIVNGWTYSPMRSWGTVPAGVHYSIKLCDGRIVTLESASFY